MDKSVNTQNTFEYMIGKYRKKQSIITMLINHELEKLKKDKEK